MESFMKQGPGQIVIHKKTTMTSTPKGTKCVILYAMGYDFLLYICDENNNIILLFIQKYVQIYIYNYYHSINVFLITTESTVLVLVLSLLWWNYEYDSWQNDIVLSL